MLNPCAMKMHWGVSVGECSASLAGYIASVETGCGACLIGRWVVPIAQLDAMKEGKSLLLPVFEQRFSSRPGCSVVA